MSDIPDYSNGEVVPETIGNDFKFRESYRSFLQQYVLEQFKGKQYYNSLLDVMAYIFDRTTTVHEDLYYMRWLAVAQGAQLDNIGYMLATERQGLDDEDYRQILYGQISRYNSMGTHKEIVNVVKLMTNAVTVPIQELYPAKIIVLIIGNDLNLNIRFLVDAINSSASGGVGVYALLASLEKVFLFQPLDGSPLPEYGRGFPPLDGSDVSYWVKPLFKATDEISTGANNIINNDKVKDE